MYVSPARNLDAAKRAFEKKDADASKSAHLERAPEKHSRQGKYIKSAVYGGLDGIITTFAVVAGIAGASLSSGIVLILGFANLIADGLSMAIGDYLSTKSEMEYHKKEHEREAWEFENFPDGEKKEMIDIYSAKGLPRKDAVKAVEILSRNKRTFIDIMMAEELGIVRDSHSALKNALVTFCSFVIFGFVPLFAYVISIIFVSISNVFLLSIILTGLTLFILGALKTKFVSTHWFKSGLEMLIVGGIAAGVAYLIGFLLQGLA